MSNQKFSNNASKFAQKCAGISGTGVSRQQITFSYQDGISKEKEIKKSGEFETVYLVRKPTRDEKGIVPSKKLSINWTQSETGQELLLIQNGVTVATFATLVTGNIAFNPYPVWDEPSDYIAIPTLTSFKAIESTSTKDFFKQWLTSEEFFNHVSILSERGTYTPQLVKMTFLFISYLIARDRVVEVNESVDVYTREIVIDKELLITDYLEFLKLLTDEDQTPKMRKLFRNAQSVLTLAPASETPSQLMAATDEVIEATVSTDTSEAKTIEEIPENPEVEPTTEAEVTEPTTDPNTAIKAQAKNAKDESI